LARRLSMDFVSTKEVPRGVSELPAKIANSAINPSHKKNSPRRCTSWINHTSSLLSKNKMLASKLIKTLKPCSTLRYLRPPPLRDKVRASSACGFDWNLQCSAAGDLFSVGSCGVDGLLFVVQCWLWSMEATMRSWNIFSLCISAVRLFLVGLEKEEKEKWNL
jgi:hypothetical protein